MKKLILLILFFLPVQFTQAQIAVVALPAMNVVYIGLDNPVQIAVEGYKNEQITVSADGCSIQQTESKSYILRASTPGKCTINVGYIKSGKKQNQSFEFRKKSLPKPECMFGTLESGNYPAAAMLAQNSIRAVMPNFVFEGISFTILSYQWTYLGNSIFNSCFEKQNGATISYKLKEIIKESNNGDAILIDDIVAVGPGGILKRLNPIEITIDNSINHKRNLNSYFFDYRKFMDSPITFHKFGDSIFCCNPNGQYPDGILRKYRADAEDTVLLYELKYSKLRVLWIKEFYPNKNIKVEYNFEENDTLGRAVSYYKSGKIKARGSVLADLSNMSKNYQSSYVKLDSYKKFLDSFLLLNFAPYGEWKGFFENGDTALNCNLKLWGISIPHEHGGSTSDGEGEYSISDAVKYKETHIYPMIIGSYKIYDIDGNIISEETFKD
jgi:antitoxin component YwqK of YwqJK toxin-antitoxin module